MRVRGACALMYALLSAVACAAYDCHRHCRNMYGRGLQTLQLPESKCKCADKHIRLQGTPPRPLIRIHELSTTVRSVPILPARSADIAPVYYEPADYYQYLSPLYQNDFNQHLYIISPLVTYKPDISQRPTDKASLYEVGTESEKRTKDSDKNENAVAPKTRFKNNVENDTNPVSVDFVKSMEGSSLYLDIGLDNTEARSSTKTGEKTKLSRVSNTEHNFLTCMDLNLALAQRNTNISKDRLNTTNFFNIHNLLESDLLREIEEKCSDIRNILKENAKDIEESRFNKKEKNKSIQSILSDEYTDNINKSTNYYEQPKHSEVYNEPGSQQETTTKDNTRDIYTSSSSNNKHWESSVTRPPHEYIFNKAGVANYIEDSTESEVSDSFSRAHIFEHTEHYLKSDGNIRRNFLNESNEQSNRLKDTNLIDTTLLTIGTTESTIQSEIFTATTPVTVELSEPSVTTNDRENAHVLFTDTINSSTPNVPNIEKTTSSYSTYIGQSLVYQTSQTLVTELPSTINFSQSYKTVTEDNLESIREASSTTQSYNQSDNVTDTTLLQTSFNRRANNNPTKHSFSTANPTELTTPYNFKTQELDSMTTRAIENDIKGFTLTNTNDEFKFVPIKRSNSYDTSTTVTLSTITTTPTEHNFPETALTNILKEELSTLTVPNSKAIQEQPSVLSTSTIMPTTEKSDISEERPKLDEAQVQIPKLEIVELKNGTTLSAVKGFENLPNNDFINSTEFSSRRDAKKIFSSKLNGTEKVSLTNQTNYNKLYQLLTGKIMFIRDNQQIPLRFLQNINGDIDLGIDGNYLCNNLVQDRNVSIILTVLCDYTGKLLS